MLIIFDLLFYGGYTSYYDASQNDLVLNILFIYVQKN